MKKNMKKNKKNKHLLTTTSFLTILLFLLFLLPVSAEVTELNAPSMVVQGDTLHISGKALPNEDVWLNSAFAFSLLVASSDKTYRCEFNDIYFPKGEKMFSVSAEGVKNLRASIYPVFWRTIEYPFDFPQNATDSTAAISISFPLMWGSITLDIYGEKDVSVYGDATDSATSINMTTDMAIKLPADASGNFTLNITTKSIPLGDFLIAAGGIEKNIEIVLEEPTPTPTPTPSSTYSRGGGGGTPRDRDGDGHSDIQEMLADTNENDPCDPNPECAKCLALNPIASATPTPTPVLSTTSTPTTPPSISTPLPTRVSTPEQSGFEAVFTITGLLIVVLILSVKRGHRKRGRQC